MENRNHNAGTAKAVAFASMERGKIFAYPVEVSAYVNTKKKDEDARNVKEAASALTAYKFQPA